MSICGEKCPNCCYIGEGDFYCSLIQKIVIEDFCPTEDFGCCDYNWKEEREKERLEQTNKRLEYAISRFEQLKLKYKVCNKNIGQVNVWRPSDNKIFSFYARTGKIAGVNNIRGIENFIKFLSKEV